MPSKEQPRLIDRFAPHDVVAIVILIGCFASIPFGAEKLVGSVILIVTGFYFGRHSR